MAWKGTQNNRRKIREKNLRIAYKEKNKKEFRSYRIITK